MVTTMDTERRRERRLQLIADNERRKLEERTEMSGASAPRRAVDGEADRAGEASEPKLDTPRASAVTAAELAAVHRRSTASARLWANWPRLSPSRPPDAPKLSSATN